MLIINELESLNPDLKNKPLYVEVEGEVLEVCGVQPTENKIILHLEKKINFF